MPGDKYLQSVLHLISLGTNGQVLAIDEDSDAGVKFVDASEGITELTSTQLGAGSGTEGSILMDNGDGTASWGELTPDQLGSDSGTAGNVLVDNGDGSAAWTVLSTTKYARLSRITSNQASISGSWAQDYLQYNEITSDADGLITSLSGDDITIAQPGIYLVLQTLYSNNNLSGYINVSVNGAGVASSDPVILASTTAIAYFRYMWVIRTTAANQVLKMGFFSSATSQMDYTDGYRPGNVNFLEILKLG